MIEEEDGDRALELNEGVAVHSFYRPDSALTDNVWDGYLVLPFAGRARGPAEDRDPRQRGGDDGARLRRVLPRDRDRRGRDRRQADRARRALLRPRQPEPRDLPRGRPPVARVLGRRLRRDHGRRLPPALHPVLPGDEGVLRARARPARPGRGRDRQRRPPRGQRRPGEGPRPHHGRGLPDGDPRPDRGLEHPAARAARAPRAASGWPRRSRASRRTFASSPPRSPSGSEPRLPGGEVYTDDRAPVEWLIDRAILGYAAE